MIKGKFGDEFMNTLYRIYIIKCMFKLPVKGLMHSFEYSIVSVVSTPLQRCMEVPHNPNLIINGLLMCCYLVPKSNQYLGQIILHFSVSLPFFTQRKENGMENGKSRTCLLINNVSFINELQLL